MCGVQTEASLQTAGERALTSQRRPSTTCSWLAATAASDARKNVTNPKPRDLPVERSFMITTSCSSSSILEIVSMKAVTAWRSGALYWLRDRQCGVGPKFLSQNQWQQPGIGCMCAAMWHPPHAPPASELVKMAVYRCQGTRTTANPLSIGRTTPASRRAIPEASLQWKLGMELQYSVLLLLVRHRWQAPA